MIVGMEGADAWAASAFSDARGRLDPVRTFQEAGMFGRFSVILAERGETGSGQDVVARPGDGVPSPAGLEPARSPGAKNSTGDPVSRSPLSSLAARDAGSFGQNRALTVGAVSASAAPVRSDVTMRTSSPRPISRTVRGAAAAPPADRRDAGAGRAAESLFIQAAAGDSGRAVLVSLFFPGLNSGELTAFRKQAEDLLGRAGYSLDKLKLNGQDDVQDRLSAGGPAWR